MARATSKPCLAPDVRLALESRETWRNDLKQPTDAKGLPGSGYGIEVDGLLKSEFVTMEGATNGARELKTRFPMLQIRIYDAASKTRTEVTA
jgi:hypothetical protein